MCRPVIKAFLRLRVVLRIELIMEKKKAVFNLSFLQERLCLFIFPRTAELRAGLCVKPDLRKPYRGRDVAATALSPPAPN